MPPGVNPGYPRFYYSVTDHTKEPSSVKVTFQFIEEEFFIFENSYLVMGKNT